MEDAPVDQENKENNDEGEIRPEIIEHKEPRLIKGNMAMASSLGLPPTEPLQILQDNTSVKWREFK